MNCHSDKHKVLQGAALTETQGVVPWLAWAPPIEAAFLSHHQSITFVRTGWRNGEGEFFLILLDDDTRSCHF